MSFLNDKIKINKDSLKITYLVILCFIVMSIVYTILHFIIDPDVYYDRLWFIFGILIAILVSTYCVYLLYVYFRPRPIYRFIYLFILFSSSIYLLAFGISSIRKDEIIVSLNPEDYYIKDLDNDSIAIYGLLVGFIIAFLALVEVGTIFLR